MLKSVFLLLVFSRLGDNFSLEPVDFVDVQDFDGIRSYPVLKVSFFPKQKIMIKTNKGDLKTSNSIKSEKTNNFKNELYDNVREFMPMSREDIKQLKKLSFHGRSPPSNDKSFNSSASMLQQISYQQPVQINYLQKRYRQQTKPSLDRRGAESHEVTRSYQRPLKVFRREKGFLPLMRPSPINLHPADPPTFQTTRNHVDYLKLRQKQFFAEFDDIKVLPNHSTGEIDYFVKREQELAEEQRPSELPKQSSSENAEADETDIQNAERVDGDSESKDAEKEEVEEEEEVGEEEGETRKHESFLPFRMYAQVRHVEAKHYEPRSKAPKPQVKEKLSLEKKNLYYKEEGYEEKDYDHGAEKVKTHFRVKRETSGATENLPIALAIISNADLKNFSGEKLLKHLDELLKNTSLFLPDDDEIDLKTLKKPVRTIYGSSGFKKSEKYPYYNLPDSNTLSTMSAFRYSENMKNFPQAKESLYKYKSINDCQDIDQDPNPVPSDIEQEGKSTHFNERPKRLNHLGDKIKCYKEKYFGKDPFDNPLFKEKLVTSSIPSPLQTTSFISHQTNPLIAVYDDVISNIRAGFEDELKQKQKKEKLEKEKELESIGKKTLPEPPISASNTITKTTKPEPKHFNSAAGLSRLPIFDINNFYPKLIIAQHDDKTPRRKQTKNDYELEFYEVEHPKKPKFSREIPNPKIPEIKNLRPPSIVQEKRWRRNPLTINLEGSRLNISPSPYFKPPNTQEKYKFKLL